MVEWPKTIYGNIKTPFVNFCLRFGITANQITIMNHAITLTSGCWLVSRGTYWGYVLGLGIFLINGLLDYLDGDVARKSKSSNRELGEWLDSGFDVVIQNAVLGAIAIGCFKQGLPLVWIVMFFIGNSASNYVSFFYNQKFGFNSCNGNKLFRQFMDKKPRPQNIFLKELIDPTSNQKAIIIYTFRYFIALGCVFNIMPLCFMAFTIITNIRWFIMYAVYALYLHGGYSLYILNALSVLDEERNEFYEIRNVL